MPGFYGEPHNVFLDIIFPVPVGRTCIIYGDKAVCFVAMNEILRWTCMVRWEGWYEGWGTIEVYFNP